MYFYLSQRLKSILAAKGISQADLLRKLAPICEREKINPIKSNNLSQYITGKDLPNQKRLSILAEALETNEVWLMGYDVPMNKNLEKTDFEKTDRTDIDSVLGIYYDILTEENINKIKTIIQEGLKKDNK